MALLEFDSSKIVAQLASSRAVLVQDVSFSVDAGKSLALIGETGSGKTIAALAIMGLLPSNVSMDAGRIVFDGRDLLALSRSEMRGLLGDSIVYIPQCGGEFLSPS